MAFTEKYISLPIMIFNARDKDLTGQENAEPAIMKVEPFQISRWYESKDADLECTCVLLNFKDGGNVSVYMPIGEFEKRLNDHVK